MGHYRLIELIKSCLAIVVRIYSSPRHSAKPHVSSSCPAIAPNRMLAVLAFRGELLHVYHRLFVSNPLSSIFKSRGAVVVRSPSTLMKQLFFLIYFSLRSNSTCLDFSSSLVIGNNHSTWCNRTLY